MLEMRRIRCAPHIKESREEQPGIPAKATHHLFYLDASVLQVTARAALRAKRGLPLLCMGMVVEPSPQRIFSGPHGPLTNKENIPLLLRA
jgi:hypothetical protein